MEYMDDDEDDSGHEMEETQLGRSTRQEGEAYGYWTMLRQQNNRSRKRLIRMEDDSVPEDKEDSGMYHYQQHPSSQQQQQPSRHYHQQQPPQHQYLDHNTIQPSPPNLHHYQRNQHPQSISSSTSFLSPPTSASPKTLVRPPTKMSISPSKSLDRRAVSNSHHHARSRENHQTLPIMGAVATSGGNDNSDSIGLSSGLLMVSLLFGFLYLIEGTNQFHNLQSALLSIIL
ncbi:hypothetical protein BGZ93_000415 [Podila epicladia]|nr:hypothetical protein BGZ93_000415 [Podila epicladia]